MSDASKAVFLSYASQDAEAAKRIAEALRAAGVEVWFDQNELTGGDAWDAKIRKQIKECALFVPIVSAATQARTEGYFRLEWRLADQRTHLMAKGKPFLLPVAIDDTRDVEAHVPDSFLEVQWTRSPNGETDAAFAGRVLSLLRRASPTPRVAPRTSDPESTSPSRTRRPAGKPRWALVLAAVLLVSIAAVVWKGISTSAGLAGQRPSLPLTEARALVEKARAVFEAGDLVNRETYLLTEALLKKAEELDVTDAEAWALHAEVSQWMYTFGFDHSAERAEAVKAQAERAVKLAPLSKTARLAYANMQLGLGENTAEAEQILKALVTENPDDWRVLRVLANLHARKKDFTECVELLKRARRLSNDHQAVTGDLLIVLVDTKRYAETEAIIAESMASKTSGRVLEFDVRVKLNWRGDAAAAAAAMERWPAWMFTEDRGMQCAAQVWMWNRQPAKALAALALFPRDYIRHFRFTGPRAALTAWLHEQAGNLQAAQTDWKTALQIADRELAVAPDNGEALHWKAWALARLGNPSAAEQIFRELIERKSISFQSNESTVGLVALGLVVGHTDWAFLELENFFNGKAPGSLGLVATRAVLDLNPCFDSVRADARFQAIRASAPAPEPSDINGHSAPPPDPKSVVVLPFANLSGDKEQEYFSDGLTEEILNALARERDLRVVPRTSAFSFKGKNVPLPEIARALNVAQVVEGSVQRSDRKVRIRCTLTRVADGFAQALPAFDREITQGQDVFALQDDVASAVLQRLTGRQSKPASPIVTQSVAAFEAYLHGRELLAQTSPSWPEAIEALQRAVDADPAFALAWANLGRACLQLHQARPDSAARLARGRKAVAEALRLDPALPEAHLAQALAISIDGSHLTAALRELDAAEARHPNDASVVAVRASLTMQQGNRALAIALARRAVELDPRNGANVNQLGNFLRIDGQYAEAERAYRAAFEILGTSIPLTNLAHNQFMRDGDVQALVRALDGVPVELRGGHYWSVRQAMLYAAGDFVGSLAAREHDTSDNPAPTLFAAWALEAMQDRAKAEHEFRRASEMLEKFWTELPGSPGLYAGRARVLAALGRQNEAIAAAEKVFELLPPEENPLSAAGGGGYIPFGGYTVLAQVLASAGRTDEALAIVEKQVAAGWWRRNYLRLNPDWALLRKDPRFREIAEKAPL